MNMDPKLSRDENPDEDGAALIEPGKKCECLKGDILAGGWH